MTTSAPEKNSLQPMLGELISFISQVAIAIRMNSSYNRVPKNPEIMPDNVMWLSDALHNLGRLGKAITSGNMAFISEAADIQASYWNSYRENIVIAAGDHFNIGNGIALLNSISDAALRLVDAE